MGEIRQSLIQEDPPPTYTATATASSTSTSILLLILRTGENPPSVQYTTTATE